MIDNDDDQVLLERVWRAYRQGDINEALRLAAELRRRCAIRRLGLGAEGDYVDSEERQEP